LGSQEIAHSGPEESRGSPVGAGRNEPIRCAIYTRKSTEEGLDQEFNSLDAQRECAEAYIQSQRHERWVALPNHYDDGGFHWGQHRTPGTSKAPGRCRRPKGRFRHRLQS